MCGVCECDREVSVRRPCTTMSCRARGWGVGISPYTLTNWVLGILYEVNKELLMWMPHLSVCPLVTQYQRLSRIFMKFDKEFFF